MTATNDTETYEYDVEAKNLMQMIINSMYSSKEYFIRELVSNASDACDKMKGMYFEFNAAGYKLESMNDLKIEIIPDPVSKTLTIKDNGIGMSREHLKEYLGVIANSGTRIFKEMQASKNDPQAKTDMASLIGQFGLGFYSAFLVAEKVDVISKHVTDKAYVWSSEGRSDFSIKPYDGEEFLHGTQLVLYIREGDEEFLETERLSNLIKKYSRFISYPIYLYVEKEVEDTVQDVVEVPEATEVVTDENNNQENLKSEELDEPAVEEIKDEVKPKKMKKVVERQHVNNEKPIWQQNIKDVPEEDMKKFYKAISGDWDDYLAVDFWHLEGIVSIKILLFIPKRNKANIFERVTKKDNIKLYCSNVFVTDDLGDAIPDWMSCIFGIIASDDLPMNVSREFLQGDSTFRLIKKTLPQKLGDMIAKLAKDEEKYDLFYKEFAGCIKFAVKELSGPQQEKFAKFLRYETNRSGSDGEGKAKLIDLDTYVSRMKEGQKQIFCITGLCRNQVANSPFLDSFSDYDVLFMTEAADEVMLQGFKSYKGKDIQRINCEGVELPNTVQNEEEDKEFIAKVKELLGDSVEKVIINPSLKNVPCVISTTKYSSSSTLERIIRSQPGGESNPYMSMMAKTRKILELGRDSPCFAQLKELYAGSKFDQLKKQVTILFKTALIGCGFILDDPAEYSKCVFDILGNK